MFQSKSRLISLLTLIYFDRRNFCEYKHFHEFREFKIIHKNLSRDTTALQPLNNCNTTFWTPDLPEGVLSNRPCPSVSPSFSPSLNILETAHSIFLKLCMKLGVNKVKKVTQPEFKKNLNPGMKGD